MAHGHIAALWEHQPLAGPVSLVLRAPFAALAQLGSDSTLAQYRLGAFGCLFACSLLILFLAHAAHRRGAHPLLCVVLAVGLLINPVTFRALDLGHPEEPLAGLLVAVAVVTAGGRRAVIAGLALGAAFATKQWALLALGPVLLAAPAPARTTVALTALAAALVLTAPAALGDPGRFKLAVQEAAHPHANATPTNVWWPLDQVSADQQVGASVQRKHPPAMIRAVSHWLIIAIAFAASLLLARRTREPAIEAVLALAALILLLRCVLDAYGTFSYHHWPYLCLLAVYEVLGRRRVPVLAAISTVCLWFMSAHIGLTHPTTLYVFYLAWTLPMLALLVYELSATRQALLSSDCS